MKMGLLPFITTFNKRSSSDRNILCPLTSS